MLYFIQGDQLNMAVCFWYLVKSDLSSVGLCTPVDIDNPVFSNIDKQFGSR